MVKSECYNCQKRYLGCHSSCESYLAYKAYKQKIQEIKDEERKTYPVRRTKIYGR